MLRTRDYVLMLSAIVFLLVGIITTAATKGGFGVLKGQDAAVFVATQGAESYSAVVEDSAETSREERVAALRKKIAALGNLGGAATEEVVVESPVPEADDTVQGPITENRCSNYNATGVAWNSAGVRLEEVEGARLVYREAKPASAASTSATSSVPTRQILAQLSVRSIPSASQSCVSNIIIGVSINGALIKNSEAFAYGSFGGETLVGYALDGFPIYGAADKKTDICGGLIEDGQYRYQISNSRDTIITCYAGTPVSL